MSSKSFQSNPAHADPEIDPIRVELLSTEMPIHQIAKGGDEEIRIMRRKSAGQIELQWRIDYNPAVGRPGQLAYRLDTWVIKRRLSELPRPLSRLVRIGDLRQIARELKHGADTAAVRRAFDQNAATLIEQILDRHGTGRVLFRNTRAAVKGSARSSRPSSCPKRITWLWPNLARRPPR